MGNDELQSQKQRYEEKICRVGKAVGVVERVYKGRGTVALRAKVILESGKVVYVDLLDVAVF